MKERMKKIKAPIPTLCYAVCILVWLVAGVLALGRDVLVKTSGSLYQFELTAEDFTLVGMHRQEDGSYITEDGDPQMLWNNPGSVAVRTLRMQADFTGNPREMCLYYTNEAGEPFGVNKRVFAAQQNDGSYLYTLPAGKIAALRLDPCSPDQDKTVEMVFEAFAVNEPVPFWHYFAPGWAGLFKMILYPGLAAAALRIAHDALLWYKSKRSK